MLCKFIARMRWAADWCTGPPGPAAESACRVKYGQATEDYQNIIYTRMPKT